MALFDNKKQLVMILGSVAVGIVAAVLVARYVSQRISEETQSLAIQYERAQKQREQQYNEQIAVLGQRVAQAEESSRRAAADAAEAAKRAFEQQQKAQQAQGGAAQAVNPKRKPGVTLALKTPPGKRALTVEIKSLGAVGGLIDPGDVVDVIAHLDIPSRDISKPKKTVTAMIFQKLKILAIDSTLEPITNYDEQQKVANLKITFAVDPQEVGLLSFADKNGKLELALRGPKERQNVMLSASTWSTLAEYILENNGADITAYADMPDIEPAQAPQKPQFNVEVQDVEDAKPYIQIFRDGREL